jgi:hypothetical protein
MGSLAAVLTAAAALVGVTVFAWPRPAKAMDHPTLPAQFAAFSPFTAHAEDRPAGRAIALFETGSWESLSSYQAIAVGADRDSYRQLTGGVGTKSWDRAILLSPDGTRVLRRRPGGGPDELEVLDLTTGTTTARHGAAWTPAPDVHNPGTYDGMAMLAWSPDGRYVAYTVHVEYGQPPPDGPDRQLVILDLDTDHAVAYPDIDGVYAAAFAPDSHRLALATTSGGIFISVDGMRLGTWLDPTGTVPTDVPYASGEPFEAEFPVGTFGLSWSPDGSSLAVATRRFCGMLSRDPSSTTVTAFVDTTDARR